MTIEIKTSTLEPIRNTFEHIKRRFGDKPASRYQEASYDVAPVTNFHYRPTWQPDKELNDPTRTAIVMEDWHAPRDPRQYYYGTYVQARAKLQEVTESNYSFFDKRNLADAMSDEVKEKITRFVLPLRHLELVANMNNIFGSAHGYGVVMVQAFLFNGMDRLGIAQYLSRIGLLLDGNSGDTLAAARLLKIGKSTFYRKLKAHGIDPSNVADLVNESEDEPAGGPHAAGRPGSQRALCLARRSWPPPGAYWGY